MPSDVVNELLAQRGLPALPGSQFLPCQPVSQGSAEALPDGGRFHYPHAEQPPGHKGVGYHPVDMPAYDVANQDPQHAYRQHVEEHDGQSLARPFQAQDQRVQEPPPAEPFRRFFYDSVRIPVHQTILSLRRPEM